MYMFQSSNGREKEQKAWREIQKIFEFLSYRMDKRKRFLKINHIQNANSQPMMKS